MIVAALRLSEPLLYISGGDKTDSGTRQNGPTLTSLQSPTTQLPTTTQVQRSTTEPDNVTEPHNVTTEPQNVTTGPHNVTTEPQNVTTEPHNVTAGPQNVTTEPQNVTTPLTTITNVPPTTTHSPSTHKFNVGTFFGGIAVGVVLVFVVGAGVYCVRKRKSMQYKRLSE